MAAANGGDDCWRFCEDEGCRDSAAVAMGWTAIPAASGLYSIIEFSFTIPPCRLFRKAQPPATAVRSILTGGHLYRSRIRIITHR
ncbi:asparaginase [Sesbania bispinosa]|nr:asparaginase [Sesbania bispinosa]